jgi:hypothetical protein
MENWRGFGSQQTMHYPSIFMEEMRKIMKASVMIARDTSGVRPKYLPNTNLEH